MSFIVLPRSSVGNPTIKPRRWGTRADLDFAIRENCQKIGLPEPLYCNPFWYRNEFSFVGNAGSTQNGVYATGNGALNYVAVKYPRLNYSEFAWFALFNRPSLLSNYENIIGSDSFNTWNTRLTGNKEFIQWYQDWAYRFSSSVPEVPYGTDAGYFGCYNSTLSSHNSWISWSKNFVSLGTTFDTRLTGSIDNATTGSDLIRLENGQHYCLTLWDKSISPQQADHLHSEPYFLIQPVTRRKYYFLPSVNHWELYVKLGVDGTWVDAGNFAPDVNEYLKTTGLESGTYYAKLRKYTNGVPSEWEYSSAITYTASGGTTNDLTGQNIVTGDPAVTSPALGQTHAIVVQNVAADAPTITNVALGQTHALPAQDIAADSPTITNAALTVQVNTDALTGQDIVAGSPAITTAALGQAHALSIQNVVSDSPSISVAVLGQKHTLTAQNIVTYDPTISVPSCGQSHVLSSQAINTDSPTINQPPFGQKHALVSTSIETGSISVSTPALSTSTTVDSLTAQDIESGSPTVTTPVLGHVHVLGGDGVTLAAPVVALPSIKQIHALGGDSVNLDSPVINLPVLNTTNALTGMNVVSGSAVITQPLLGQKHVLGSISVESGAPVVSLPSSGQTHDLTGLDCSVAEPEVSLSEIGQAHVLFGENIELGSPEILMLGMITLDEVGRSVSLEAKNYSIALIKYS